MPIETKHFESWLSEVPVASDKAIAITGTTTGTGYWASVFAIRKNANALLLLNRPSPRVEEAFRALQAEKSSCGSSTAIHNVPCDLMDFESVRRAAEKVNEICKELGGLDALGNNAGFGPALDLRTNAGYDVQMQVNYLSHFLLMKCLFPSFDLALENGKEVRICQQSSGARYMSQNPHEEKYFTKIEEGTLGGNGANACFERYHQSKLANIAFALKLSSALGAKGYDTEKIKSICTEPGFAETNLVSNSASHLGLFLGSLAKVVIWVMARTKKRHSAADGSLTLAHACLADDVSNGDFFQPDEYDVGTPTKSLAEGRLDHGKPDHEKLCLDPVNQELCWKMSEEALGDFFEFSKLTRT